MRAKVLCGYDARNSQEISLIADEVITKTKLFYLYQVYSNLNIPTFYSQCACQL